MEQHWIVKERNRDLIVFALGWASDFHAVAHIRPEGYDILCTDDYRTIESVDPATVAGYRRIYLFAWSFGVWVSELIFRGIPFYKTVALNGTPLPVNNRYGIPPKSFAVTLKGIARTGIEAFNRRTFGNFYDTIAPWARNKVFRGEVRRVVQPVRCVGQSLPSFDHMERSRDRASGHHLPAGQRKSLLDRRVSRNRGTVMSRHAALSVCRPGNRTVEAAHRTTDAIPPP